jgi:hypothetical protein
MIATFTLPSLSRQVAPICALSLDRDFMPDWHGRERRSRLIDAPTRLTLHGQKVVATPRFWRSLSMRCGLNDSIFRYFDPDEVFARISDRSGDRQLRFTLEHWASGEPRLLAAAEIRTPVIDIEGAQALLTAHGGQRISYQDGRLTSMHVPVDGPGRFRIGPDDFENRFSLELPLDGLGEPRMFTVLLRLICANGAVAQKSAFQSDIRLGEDPWHAIDRALCTYADADGFSAMRQRFESAQRSWASLEEVRSLEQVLAGMSWGTTGGADRRTQFHRMVGDLPGIYGVASLDAISPKRRRLLPSRSRVYDLLNFASELASHHAPPAGTMRINTWIGNTIVSEYDLEGSAQEVSDFEALFMPAAGADPAQAAPAQQPAPLGQAVPRSAHKGARKGLFWRSTRN